MEGKFAFIRNIDEVPALMMISDVVVSASIEPEAFGRLDAEGQAMGRIVLASNIGGSLDSVLDGVSGKLFESNNPQALADALHWALNISPEERQKFAQAGIKNIKEHFTKQIMCDKTIAVYNELLNLKTKNEEK